MVKMCLSMKFIVIMIHNSNKTKNIMDKVKNHKKQQMLKLKDKKQKISIKFSKLYQNRENKIADNVIYIFQLL